MPNVSSILTSEKYQELIAEYIIRQLRKGGPGSGWFREDGHVPRGGADNGAEYNKIKKEFNRNFILEYGKTDKKLIKEAAKNYKYMMTSVMENPKREDFTKNFLTMLGQIASGKKIMSFDEWAKKSDLNFKYQDREEFKNIYDGHVAGVKATYKTTQNLLQNNKLTLYRGITPGQKISDRSVNFWTTDKKFAAAFAGDRGTVVSGLFSAKNIVYHTSTNYVANGYYNKIVKNVVPIKGADEALVFCGGAKIKKVARGKNADWLNYDVVKNMHDDVVENLVYRFAIDDILGLEFKKTFKGGSGSGNFGHSGRPGRVGGSGGGSGNSLGSKEPITESDKELFDQITTMKDMISKRVSGDLKYSSGYDMVLKHGKFYQPQELPKDVKVGTLKECYSNAGSLAMFSDKYSYVEGFALSSGIPFPIAHAFCIDKKTGNVVDPTWASPKLGMGTSYFGIKFNTTFLRKTIAKKKTWGLIPDFPDKKYDPMKNGFPEDAFKGNVNIDLSIIKDKKKDHKNYYYIEDFIDVDKKYGLQSVLKGGSGSGNFGHSGRPGRVGGSGGLGLSSDRENRQPNDNEIRNRTDKQILSKLKKDIKLQSVSSFKGFSVDDRLQYVKLSQTHSMVKNKDLLIDGKSLVSDLSTEQKNYFVDRYPKTIQWITTKKQTNNYTPPDLEEMDKFLSVKQKERMSDNFDSLAGDKSLPPIRKWSFFDECRYSCGLFSKNKDIALENLITGWQNSSDTIDSKIIRNISSNLFKENRGIKFYKQDYSEAISGKYSPKRMEEALLTLKKETEAYYKGKLNKSLMVSRGVGGKIKAYTPSSMESWSTDKNTPKVFGRIMSNNGVYSILNTKVHYKDVLWSYESIKGKYGSPDSALNGKKEFVVIGGNIKNVSSKAYWKSKTNMEIEVIIPRTDHDIERLEELDKTGILAYGGSYPTFTNKKNTNTILLKQLGISTIIKGGSGSGNFGHSGRPGRVGGSGGLGLSSDASKISKSQSMKQADYSDIKDQMKRNLSKISSGKVDLISVKGQLTDKSILDIKKNMDNTLSACGNYLAGDTMARARDYTDAFSLVLSRGLKDGSLNNIDAKHLNNMAVDNIKKMLHQEVESNRQQFTDHGIRHITGDVLRQRDLMHALSNKVTAKQELMADFALVNHDIGYTAPLIRQGGTRAVIMSKQHPLYSTKITGQQVDQWNKDKVFSKKEYGQILKTIRTHDRTNMDVKDLIGTTSRMSDNLSLFNKEKLPSVFKYVKGGDQHLLKMGEAAAKNDTKTFDKYKTQLYDKIDKANLSQALKRDLKAATKEISYLTPKFSMGTLAGEISSIKGNKGRVEVNIKYNAYDAKLQKLFNMGQKQTKKFLEDYGITKYNKTEYNVGNLLKLKVHGYKGKKEEEEFIIKGGPGSGWFREDGHVPRGGGKKPESVNKPSKQEQTNFGGKYLAKYGSCGTYKGRPILIGEFEMSEGKTYKEAERLHKLLKEVKNAWAGAIKKIDPEAVIKSYSEITKRGRDGKYVTTSTWLQVKGNVFKKQSKSFSLGITLYPAADGTTVKINDSGLPKELQRKGIFTAGLKVLNKDKFNMSGKMSVHLSTNDKAWSTVAKKMGFNWKDWQDGPWVRVPDKDLHLFRIDRMKKSFNLTITKSNKQERAFIKYTEKKEKEFLPIIQKYFEEQYNDLSLGLKEIGINQVIKVPKARWFFDQKKWDKKLQTIGYDYITDLYKQYGSIVFEELKLAYPGANIVGSFDVTFGTLEEFIDHHAYQFATGVNTITNDAIRSVMDYGMTEGLSNNNISKLIKELFDSYSKERAMLIARTETIRASNGAAVEAYKQSGVVTKKVWWTTADDRTCPYCLSLHNKVVGIDENFYDKGTELKEKDEEGNPITMKLDYEDVGHPPLHPNCRCVILAKVSKRYELGINTLLPILKGGPGSGNYGHAGRPGKVGGSITSLGRSISTASDEKLQELLDNTARLDSFIGGTGHSNSVKNKKSSQKRIDEIIDGNKEFDRAANSTWYADHPGGGSSITDRDTTNYNRREAIEAIISDWAGSSDNTSQGVAKNIFKLHDCATEHLLGDKPKDKYKILIAENLKAQYKATQTDLKKLGIKEVILYRGMEDITSKDIRVNESDSGIYSNATVNMQPISSFSTRLGVAENFSGGRLIMAIRVPAHRILSTPKSGFGCTNEKEVTVLGGKMKALVSFDNFDEDAGSIFRDYLKNRKQIKKGAPEEYNKLITIDNIDENIFNADWTKRTWDVDIPKFGTDKFNEWLGRHSMTLEQFKKLPIYQYKFRKKQLGISTIIKGGQGSGHWSHAGRQSRVGGSIQGRGTGGYIPYKKGAKDLPEHIKKLAIPPAWTGVVYHPDPNARYWAKGRDKKGRSQPIPNPNWSKKSNVAKFNRVEEMRGEAKKIIKEINADLKSKEKRTRENATVARLLAETAIRPGSNNDTKAEKKAYGATTLQGRHVKIKKDGVYLEFTGKKGVKQSHLIEDKSIAKDLVKRAKAVGEKENIFDTNNQSLLKYSKGLGSGGFKPKDFRTLTACVSADRQVSKLPKPTTAKQYKEQVKVVALSVSKKLGNEPAECLKSYIDPGIFSGWRTKLPKEEQAKLKPKKKKKKKIIGIHSIINRGVI